MNKLILLIFSLLSLNSGSDLVSLRRAIRREIKLSCKQAKEGAVAGIPVEGYCTSLVARVDAIFESAVLPYQEKLHIIKFKNDNLIKESENFQLGVQLQKELIKLQPEKDKLLDEERAKQSKHVEAEENLQRNKEIALHNFKLETSRLNSIPSKKTFFEHRLAPVAGYVLTTLGESPITVNSVMGKFDGDDLIIYSLATIYPIASSYLCDAMGKDLAIGKPIRVVLKSSALLFLLGSLIWFRRLGNEPVLSPVNLFCIGILAFSILLSRRIHKYRPYWNAKEELEKACILEKNNKVNSQAIATREKEIDDTIFNKAKSNSLIHEKSLNDAKDTLGSEYLNNNTKINSMKIIAENLKTEGLEKTRQAYASVINLFNSGRNGAIGLALMIASLGFTSCNNATENIEVMNVWDKSQSQSYSYKDKPEIISDYIINKEFELNKPENLFNGFKYYVVVVADRDIPVIQEISFEPDTKFFLFRNKKRRLDELAAFENRIRNAVESVSKIPDTFHYSSLYRHHCYSLKRLMESGFSNNKKYIFFSDGLENRIISLSKYAANTSALKRDIPTIASILENDCSLVSLKGLEVTLVCSPDINTGDLVIAANDGLWRNIFEKKGATFSFKGNLN